MLSEKEQTRYLRQLILPEFGEEGQLKIKNSKVLIIGAGGLGGPVSYYLAAAGVGHLIICDRDKVELSNLNRQILHGTNDIDVSKADSAHETLSNLNPSITVETHEVAVDDSNIAKYAEGVDVIVDCLDNVPSRFVINRYSIETGTAVVHAGIDCWTGQLTLLNPPHTPCVNCLFDGAEEDGKPKPVLGAVAGVIGTMQALETINYLTGRETFKNKLMFFDAHTMEWVKMDLHKNPDCSICGEK